jgi:hypothetical protein
MAARSAKRSIVSSECSPEHRSITIRSAPIALQLCWCLFGDFLRASTGLDGVDDRTFAQSIGATVALILDADVPLVS